MSHKALVYEMPYTLAALELLSALGVAGHTDRAGVRVPDVEDRRVLDAELCGDVTKLDGMGDARIAAAAKEIACRLDAQAVVDRAAKGGGGRPHGDDSAGPRHDDVCHRAPGRSRKASVCNQRRRGGVL